MVKKHITHTEDEYNEDGELVSSTEEHLIIETHNFLEEDEDEEDLMFLGKKEYGDFEDDTPLIVINNDDGFW